MKDAIKQKPFVVMSLAMAIVLIGGVLSFAGPCVHDDGTSATCHTASYLIVASGLIASVCALAAFFLKRPLAAGAFSLIAALGGLCAALAPGTLFTLCMMHTMRCWTVMRPFALICGGILCLSALCAAITLFHTHRKHYA